MANIFVLANRFYSTNYQNHPLVTLAFTNASLSATSDTLAQSISLFKQSRPSISQNEPSNIQRPFPSQQLDFARLGRFTIYGFSIAPVIHTWFTFLDKKFPFNKQLISKSNLIKQNQMIFKRVLFDQVGFAPIGLFLFFGGISILEGKNFKGIKEKLQEAYFPALKVNYTVWPLVQFINFRYLPLKYRVPFVSAVGVLWTAYLSLLNSKTNNEITVIK